jgi:hypothetical protein
MDEDGIIAGGGDGSPLLTEIWFTDIDGHQARIVGEPPAIESLKKIFERVGVTYDEQSDSWDEGYYCEPAEVTRSADN